DGAPGLREPAGELERRGRLGQVAGDAGRPLAERLQLLRGSRQPRLVAGDQDEPVAVTRGPLRQLGAHAPPPARDPHGPCHGAEYRRRYRIAYVAVAWTTRSGPDAP